MSYIDNHNVTYIIYFSYSLSSYSLSCCIDNNPENNPKDSFKWVLKGGTMPELFFYRKAVLFWLTLLLFFVSETWQYVL